MDLRDRVFPVTRVPYERRADRPENPEKLESPRQRWLTGAVLRLDLTSDWKTIRLSESTIFVTVVLVQNSSPTANMIVGFNQSVTAATGGLIVPPFQSLEISTEDSQENEVFDLSDIFITFDTTGSAYLIPVAWSAKGQRR